MAGILPGPDFDRARTQIATPFRFFDLDLSVARAGAIIDVSGDYLYIDPDPDGVMAAGGQSISGFAQIELNSQADAPMCPLFVQAGFALNALFTRLRVSHAAQPGKKLRVCFSTGERVVPTNSSVITGTVTTLELHGESARRRNEFWGYKMAGAMAANYSMVQLWNDVSNGSVAYLRKITVNAIADSFISVVHDNAKIPTNNGGSGYGSNKVIGHTASTLQIPHSRELAIPPIDGTYFTGQLTANQLRVFDFDEPLIIRPGYGVTVYNWLVNTGMSVTFDWREKFVGTTGEW